MHRWSRAIHLAVNLDALPDEELSEEIEIVKEVRLLLFIVQIVTLRNLLLHLMSLHSEFEVNYITRVFKDSHLIHARGDRGQQDKTVAKPVVLEIVLTEPIGSVVMVPLNFIIRLNIIIHILIKPTADLEALSFIHALVQHCIADKLFSNFAEPTHVELPSLAHSLVYLAIIQFLQERHNRVAHLAVM